ncbi:acyl-CoA dehydrogenase [Tilletiaria anomala UBC 951]|uniref:Acyl-CoA dehydrogenase n=1 Tax=Tilletiaria anomala (strain ATCC 24038 / CBS 436.72 / UBC 951) TaxID=1037660 RepID=A0A066V8Y4_TILAU|nr:acyl-CoA dehydrogenase [Tilletiaria anomala UBC 951]KDN37911.1 acyl-CoA dehydrogenase [Tilletiaria anomala UBC 951]
MSSSQVKVPSEPFGSVLPFAEPAWYGSLGDTSPFYTDSHRRLRAYCRDYVDSFSHKAGEWEDKGTIPSAQYQEHAARGFVAASIQPFHIPSLKAAGIQLPANIPPEEWDNLHNVVLFDELMRHGFLGVNWALGGGNGIGGPPLVNFGSEDLKRELLPDILLGKKRICLGVTEPLAGSDVAGIKTTAVRSTDGKHYIINGQKKWITNGVFADYCTTVVRTGEEDSGAGGISVIVVPMHLEGIERRLLKNSGVNVSGSTIITFDDVKVPARYLLGKENQGFRIVMSNFNGERLALAVSALRMSRVCIEDAYAYACKRHTFGKPLIEQPIIQSKFADMGRRVEALHAWMEALAHQMHACGNTPQGKKIADMELGGRIALLKVESGYVLELCVREAQQIMGGLGYQRGGDHAGARIEQISRDLRVMVVGGGSAEILSSLGVKMEKMKADARL